MWENAVLKKMKVKDREDFLNITDTNNIVSTAMSDGLKRHWAELTSDQRKSRSKNAVSAMHLALNNPAVKQKLSLANCISKTVG